ncbi:MAG TPA: hypothetical protein VF384_14325 [Planctomycetota bacterium]
MPSHAPSVCLLCLAALAQPLFAHGGQYRGPSSATPPQQQASGSNQDNGGSSGSGSGSGSRSGSGTSSQSGSGSSGPSTGASAPGAPGGASLGGKARGAALDDDLGRWEFWWEFGKDPYLRLRDAIYGTSGGMQVDDALLNPGRQRPLQVERPTAADLDRVAATLVATLKQATNRDTITACLVALAKIGRDGPDWTIHSAVVPFLASGDQEQRETAALALGIGGTLQQASIDLLCQLVRDSEPAQKLSAGSSVNERTRAFAAFALGLTLQRLRDPANGHQIVRTLLDVLEAPAKHGRNLEVAAIEALSLLPGHWATAAGNLHGGVVRALGAYYDLDLGPGEQLLQAHVPPAIARLLQSGDAEAATWKQRFAADLAAGLDRSGPAARNSKVNPHIAQSCALALGVLATPWDRETDVDAPIGKLLLDVYRRHHDQQTRSFAILSLARQGGSLARDALLRELDRAGQAIERPWCAMALGVWSARASQAPKAGGPGFEGNTAVREALRQQFAAARNPSTIGSLAVALGLASDDVASDKLRASLLANSQQDEVAGYLAIALGLMRDQRARADIRTLRQNAARRPFLQMQCVRALGLLGDHTLVDELCRELEGPDQTLVHLSAAASSLGQIGDRRSIEPLLALLNRNDLAPLSRAFAAVALGGVCDKDPLPWNTPFSTFTNYRASTETLTDGAAGILDIL